MSDKSLLQVSPLDEVQTFEIQLIEEAGSGLSSEAEAVELDDFYDLELDKSNLGHNVLMYENFLDELACIVERAQTREGVDAAQQWPVIGAFAGKSMEELTRDKDGVIAVRLRGRSPAMMSANGKRFASRNFRPHRSHRDPERFDRVLEIWLRHIDHIVEINVQSTNASNANQMALWVERTLIRDGWRILEAGAERWEWLSRGPDIMQLPGQQNVHTRQLVFKLRLYEVLRASHPAIRKVFLRVGTQKYEI